MPGMDGLAVLREARAQGITTPALFLTAKAEIEDRVTGLDAGADDYLPKPFDASEMEVIWTYIGFLRKKLRQIGADIEIKPSGRCFSSRLPSRAGVFFWCLRWSCCSRGAPSRRICAT